MRGSHRLARAALGLAGGALVGCSLPPLLPWPVGLVGMALVVVALDGRSLKGRVCLGLLVGLGQFSIGLAWALQFNSAGYVALVIVETAMVALALALAPPSGTLRVPAIAAVLVLAEWLRDSWPFGGLPLGSAVLGQMGGPLQFTARLGGPLLVLLALVLAGGGLGEGALALSEKSPRKATSSLSCVLAAAALAGAGYTAGPGGGDRSTPLKVAIVQGGGRRGLDALQVPASQVFDAALSETGRVFGHPDLILWPEDVVGMGAERFKGSGAEHDLAEIARRLDATLIAGVTEDVGQTKFLNEVVALSPAGRLVATFEKVHRVPFGEYVPYRSFFSHFANLRDIPRDAIAGKGSGVIATPAGHFAVLISYEVFFADRGRSGVRAGGNVILVPTNTSSYSTGQAPSQEIAASRLQALEEGRYVLQAAPTGYSAVITPAGSVERRSSLSAPTVIEATVYPISYSTPYEETGDLPVLVVALLLVLLGWVVREDRTEPV